MSKSVSDQKVEDVLSSVRRLVSSELPRKPRASVPEGPGALVLTEAHRVETDRQAKARARSHSLEERIAELEAAVGGQGEEFEPDGSEDQAQHRPDRIVYTRPPNSRDDAGRGGASVRLSQIALIETGPANDDGEARPAPAEFRRETRSRRPAEPPSEPPAETPEAPMAEDVPVQPARSGEVKAFTNPDEVVANIEARIASGRPISEPLPLVEPVVAPKEEAGEESDDFDTALSQAVAASVASSEKDEGDTSSRVHSADVLKADEFDPSIFTADTPDPQVTAAELLSDPEDTVDDVPEAVAEVAAPKAPVEEARAEPEPAPSAAPVEDAAPPPEPVAAAAEALAALPDEEAMRLLVARMIRDELQGELGERITRNVRKLVRREIKRALTSKDLI